jgi:hypothetical protein
MRELTKENFMNYPKRVIKKGEKDTGIAEAIQRQLQKRGITNVAVDDDFGDETVSAVKLFQTLNRDKHGNPLEADGIVGPMTWEALFDDLFTPDATAPSDFLREALSFAQTQVGVMEKPPGSNKGPEVQAYQKSVGIPAGTFWCAAFVYFCFDEAAKKLGMTNPVFKTGGCLHHWNNSSAKKVKAAAARDDPSLVKPGHIFIIDHGQGHGHTGIVKRVEGGRLITIEGNSNPNGSSNGIGVFELDIRKVWTPSLKGYLDYS